MSIATLPLAGVRVLVTRAQEQAGELVALLESAGATPVLLPAIEILPAPAAPLDAALRRLTAYDWLVLTSVNGVRAIGQRMAALAIRPADAPDVSVAAIGRATRTALEEIGFPVEYVPEAFVAEALVEGLVSRGVAGRRILLPRADIARDVLPQGLRAAGAQVDVIVAYRTRAPQQPLGTALSALHAGQIDVVTFGSPSAVRNVVALHGGPFPEGVSVACIGPITAEAATASGLRVDIVAEEYSMPGLVDALARHLGG